MSTPFSRFGTAGATAVNDIAELSMGTVKPVFALYVGDFDSRGMFMSEVDLPRRLALYGAAVTLRSVALLQSDAVGLPNFDAATKTGDKRHAWFVENYGSTCWELDAMNPNDLRERMRQSIDEYLDHDAWAHATKIEKAQVESMQAFHKSWQASKYSGSAQ